MPAVFNSALSEVVSEDDVRRGWSPSGYFYFEIILLVYDDMYKLFNYSTWTEGLVVAVRGIVCGEYSSGGCWGGMETVRKNEFGSWHVC